MADRHTLYLARTGDGLLIMNTCSFTSQDARHIAFTRDPGYSLLSSLPRSVKKWTDEERWQALVTHFGWSVIKATAGFDLASQTAMPECGHHVPLDSVCEQCRSMATTATITSHAFHTALCWLLWHHQGGSSEIGQPVRALLGMGRFERMSDAQVALAKEYRDINLFATTPDAWRGDAQTILSWIFMRYGAPEFAGDLPDYVVRSVRALETILAKPSKSPDPCPGCKPGIVCRTPKCGRALANSRQIRTTT